MMNSNNLKSVTGKLIDHWIVNDRYQIWILMQANNEKEILLVPRKFANYENRELTVIYEENEKGYYIAQSFIA